MPNDLCQNHRRPKLAAGFVCRGHIGGSNAVARQLVQDTY
jgi:hypothetical protein